MTQPSPRLAGIRLHPIKALDPISVNEARIGPNGGLELDRVWALFSADGKWINGKRAPAIHLIRATYKPDLSSVGLSAPEDHGGIVPGPTIVSTASLEAVCDWFPGITLNESRERFRATLEIDGVPAFWEDQLFGPDENYAVRFKIGAVAFEGSHPCARCPVPPRNPRNGEEILGFSRTFSDMRRNSIPPWTPEPRFDHYYRLSTNTRIPSSEQGKLLRLGDAVVVAS